MTDVNSSCSLRENSGINRKRGGIENALPSSQRNEKAECRLAPAPAGVRALYQEGWRR